MTQLEKVLYTAKVRTTGGRDHGVARSDDGRLDVRFSTPGVLGTGTNPEQMFAAGWAVCFEGAIGIAASKRRVTLPADMAIDSEVDLCLSGGTYSLRVRLNVNLPGMQREVAQALLDSADQTCPYSKAIRGNVEVTIRLV